MLFAGLSDNLKGSWRNFRALRTYSHLFIMAVLSATAAVSVAQETCVWDSPDGIWSTETVDRPWNGSRYFINGQDVRFNDMLTDDGSLTQSVVTVSGSVLPGTIYFNNTKTVFDIGFTGDSSSIGVDGQVFHSPVFKSGTGDAYVSAPIHSGAVTVNAGRLFITNALDYPEPEISA